jgi:pimeloyl-ACP methyl ester carboxylesterase
LQLPSGSDRSIDVGGTQLACTLYGPERGPLAVLLHGFPACRQTWDRVARRLADQGVRVVAPDMRGYGGSSRPSGVRSYSVRHLVEDVVGLVRALGEGRAHVVGHDWGGVVAWWTAMLRPEIVDHLAVVNAPHPVGYERALRTAAQLRRSWYVLAFQVPLLPEWILGRHDGATLREIFAKDGVAPEIAEACVAALQPPGAGRAAVDYYRAAFRGRIAGTMPAPAVIERPTLVVWGDRDRYLERSLSQPPPDWVPAAVVKHLPDSTHWAPVDAPDDVARALLQHFSASEN